MQTMKKEREILAIPHRIHAMVTCTLFCQWQTRLQAVGRTLGLSIGSGRMVMPAAADLLVGSSNPGTANVAAAARTRSYDLKSCNRVRYHSAKAGCDINVSPHCLEPSSRKGTKDWGTERVGL